MSRKGSNEVCDDISKYNSVRLEYNNIGLRANMQLQGVYAIWASVKLGDTLAMRIWRETINGILCCFGGNTGK